MPKNCPLRIEFTGLLEGHFAHRDPGKNEYRVYDEDGDVLFQIGISDLQALSDRPSSVRAKVALELLLIFYNSGRQAGEIVGKRKRTSEILDKLGVTELLREHMNDHLTRRHKEPR